MTMTETKDTYNGWTNRETWAIQLHLSNNEGDYLAARESAQEIWRTVEVTARKSEFVATLRSAQVSAMARWVEEWIESVFEIALHPDYDAGEESSATARMVVSDVGSYWRANFREIAEHWIAEAYEEFGGVQL